MMRAELLFWSRIRQAVTAATCKAGSSCTSTGSRRLYSSWVSLRPAHPLSLAEARPAIGRGLLADDHEIVRQHVRAILEEAGFEIAGEALDGHQAVRLARWLRPDLVILDVSMPRLNGFGAAEEILEHAPQTRIILLTVHADRGYVLRAFHLGVRGYVVKNQLPADLLAAIEEVARGRTYQSPTLSEITVPA